MGDEFYYKQRFNRNRTRNIKQGMVSNGEEGEIKVITFVKQAEQYIHPVKLSKQ